MFVSDVPDRILKEAAAVWLKGLPQYLRGTLVDFLISWDSMKQSSAWEANSRLSIQEPSPHILWKSWRSLPSLQNLRLVTIFVRRNWWKLRKPWAWRSVSRLKHSWDVGSFVSDVKEVKRVPLVAPAYGCTYISTLSFLFWLFLTIVFVFEHLSKSDGSDNFWIGMKYG